MSLALLSIYREDSGEPLVDAGVAAAEPQLQSGLPRARLRAAVAVVEVYAVGPQACCWRWVKKHLGEDANNDSGLVVTSLYSWECFSNT